MKNLFSKVANLISLILVTLYFILNSEEIFGFEIIENFSLVIGKIDYSPLILFFALVPVIFRLRRTAGERSRKEITKSLVLFWVFITVIFSLILNQEVTDAFTGEDYTLSYKFDIITVIIAWILLCVLYYVIKKANEKEFEGEQKHSKEAVEMLTKFDYTNHIEFKRAEGEILKLINWMKSVELINTIKTRESIFIFPTPLADSILTEFSSDGEYSEFKRVLVGEPYEFGRESRLKESLADKMLELIKKFK